jgi:PPOX class probable FMN-dependent enzyme
MTAADTSLDRFQVTDADQLRSMYGSVPKRAAGKVHSALDVHDREFVARSPFLVLATAARDGLLDVSPRGDRPGFVCVAAPTRLVLPDRPGNNRVDSMLNVLTDPRLSLIFLIPGLGHTLRVNGTATVTTDPGLRALGEVNGRLPRTALDITVREVLYQCPRALVRSGLWDPARQVDAASMPSLDEVLAAQVDHLTLEESLEIGAASVHDPLW